MQQDGKIDNILQKKDDDLSSKINELLRDSSKVIQKLEEFRNTILKEDSMSIFAIAEKYPLYFVAIKIALKNIDMDMLSVDINTINRIEIIRGMYRSLSKDLSDIDKFDIQSFIFYFTNTPKKNDVYESLPLVATNYKSIKSLKKILYIKYYNDKSFSISYIVNGMIIEHRFSKGYADNELAIIRNSDLGTQAKSILSEPLLVIYKSALETMFICAYTKENEAKTSMLAISFEIAKKLKISNFLKTDDRALPNTIRHILSGVVLSMFHGEDSVNFVMDIHERHKKIDNGVIFDIDECEFLRTGKFKNAEEEKSAIDNYIDIINNQIGGKLGSKLRNKYQKIINNTNGWTLEESANFLNDFLYYLKQSLKYDYNEFKTTEEIVKKVAVLFTQVKHGEEKAKQLLKSLNISSFFKVWKCFIKILKV